MDEILRTLGRTGLAVGLAWVAQTCGIEDGGLLAWSPLFFVTGATIAGCGAGVVAWPFLDELTRYRLGRPLGQP